MNNCKMKEGDIDGHKYLWEYVDDDFGGSYVTIKLFIEGEIIKKVGHGISAYDLAKKTLKESCIE